MHYKTLKKFSNLSRNFLLEKPISNSLEEIDLIFKLVKLKKLRLFSGYMMRFDPRVIFISKILKKKSIIYSNFVWHTYFPNWHPYENYRNSYAIKKKMGGGVIKTCSHEVDLSHLLNGRVKEIMCLQRPNKLSNEVEESVIINLIHSNGSLSKIDLDFTTKKIRRYFVIFTKKFFIRWDFYKRYVEIKKYNEKRIKKIFFNFNVEKLYKDQNKYIYKCILDKIILKKNFIFETEKIIHNCLKSIKLNKNIKLN